MRAAVPTGEHLGLVATDAAGHQSRSAFPSHEHQEVADSWKPTETSDLNDHLADFSVSYGTGYGDPDRASMVDPEGAEFCMGSSDDEHFPSPSWAEITLARTAIGTGTG